MTGWRLYFQQWSCLNRNFISGSFDRKFLLMLLQRLWEQSSFLILELFQSRIFFDDEQSQSNIIPDDRSVSMRTKFLSCRTMTNRRLYVWAVSISKMQQNYTFFLMEIEKKGTWQSSIPNWCINKIDTKDGKTWSVMQKICTKQNFIYKF